MLIVDESNKTIILESLYDPIPSNYFWVLDLEHKDYMLQKLTVLEEIVGPTVFINAGGFVFNMPAAWNVLICGEDTGQVDIVDAATLTTNTYYGLVSGPKIMSPKTIKLNVIDYKIERCVISPFLPKHQMLCHPISPSSWINISPCDSFNKHLKNSSMADFF